MARTKVPALFSCFVASPKRKKNKLREKSFGAGSDATRGSSNASILAPGCLVLSASSDEGDEGESPHLRSPNLEGLEASAGPHAHASPQSSASDAPCQGSACQSSSGSARSLHHIPVPGPQHLAAHSPYSSALLLACRRGDLDRVRALLEAGQQEGLSSRADIDRTDQLGWSPLFYAASRGHASCVELLVKHGADQQRTDCTGRTPKHWAACKGHPACAALLQ